MKITGQCKVNRNGADCTYEVTCAVISGCYEWMATLKRDGRVLERRVGTTYVSPGMNPEAVIKAEVELAFQSAAARHMADQASARRQAQGPILNFRNKVA